MIASYIILNVRERIAQSNHGELHKRQNFRQAQGKRLIYQPAARPIQMWICDYLEFIDKISSHANDICEK